MKNNQNGFIFPALIALLAVVLVGSGIYVYKNKAGAPALSGSCQDFPMLSGLVLRTIEKPDSEKAMEANPSVITSFHWKRKSAEPFVTYPIEQGVKAYYGDEKTNRTVEDTVSAVRKSSGALGRALGTATRDLGLSADSLNTLPWKSFPNQDANQTFAFKKGTDLYSVVLNVASGEHQAPPQGEVTITCGRALTAFDKIYDALNLKADPSVEDTYNDDYVAIGDVSPDKVVYAILGSSNQISIADYYRVDEKGLTLISKDSYPATCEALAVGKAGKGMRCFGATSSDETANDQMTRYSDGVISFEYPSMLSVKKTGDLVALSHSIAYKHPDVCDGKGDAPPRERLSDFDVSFKVVSKGIQEYVTSSEWPSWEYVSKNPFTVGSWSGFKISPGVEGCGEDIYYLAISPVKTLVITRPFVAEFNPINADYRTYLALPGVIAPSLADGFFSIILESISL